MSKTASRLPFDHGKIIGKSHQSLYYGQRYPLAGATILFPPSRSAELTTKPTPEHCSAWQRMSSYIFLLHVLRSPKSCQLSSSLGKGQVGVTGGSKMGVESACQKGEPNLQAGKKGFFSY